MHVLFCRPSSPQDQDDGFDLEAEALDFLGIEPMFITMEAVVEDRLEAELAALGADCGQTLLRSWMLTEEEYRALFMTLAEHGCHLVNDGASFAAAHYLPNYFDVIAKWAAPTQWIWGTDLDEAWEAARLLGPPPYLIKDHVKSAKENPAACFVPRDADRRDFDRICEDFIEHRGERFERGLVFRSVLPLAPLSLSRTNCSTYDEYRLFFWQGELISASPYFDQDGGQTDFSEFSTLGQRIDSDFFTVDVARLTNGGWAVIEVGDGGVSTLPPLQDPREFYRALFQRTEEA